MIKFEFTLSDADAENLFDCINNSIAQANLRTMDALAENNSALVEAYRREAKYLAELKTKLTNTQVG